MQHIMKHDGKTQRGADEKQKLDDLRQGMKCFYPKWVVMEMAH